MSRDWEGSFSSWGTAPGKTEQEKCENAERAVRKAIDASERLKGKTIEVFVQGSYANRTNVRADSDVDICVLYKDGFFPDYSMSQGLNNAVLGFSDHAYRYAEFKNDVETALKQYFGSGSVTRGNKAFDVHANTYRIDADVVPCFEYLRYHGTPQSYSHHSGTELHPDRGGAIVNWPRQNYQNGVQKNDATSRRFKAVTRILKSLRNEMVDNGHKAGVPVPSYLIECLVWNVPNTNFGHDSYKADVREAILYLWQQTKTEDTCKEWGEVNELKYLFRAAQPWTRDGVNSFLQAAWNYIGLK